MIEMNLSRPLSGTRRRTFVRLCAIALAQAAFAAAAAFLVQNIFDAIAQRGADGGSVTAELRALGMLASIGGALAWLRRMERITSESLGQAYVHAVRLALYDHLGRLTPRDLHKRGRGGHLLRFTGDLTALRQWVSLGLARLAVAVIVVSVSLGALIFIDPAIAAAIAASLLLGGGAVTLVGRALGNAMRESRNRRARLATDISERIAVMPVVQMFSQVRRERARIARRSATLRDAMMQRARVIGTLRALTEATLSLAVVGILAVGVYQVGHESARLGAIVAAMSVVGMLTPAVRDLGRVYEYWHAYGVAMNRIRSFLEQRPSVPAGSTSRHALRDGAGAIQFDDVTFGAVLNRIRAHAAPGTVIGLTGANGSGKSTLLSLVARLIEPDSGRILIDGCDISECSTRSVRAAIGVVSADLPLMRGTIRRNVCYRHPKASEDEIARVCALCGVDEIAARIPGGLDARVVEGGANLSLGERQRIALARALIGSPRILLLDEVDAHMDPQSTRVIDRVLSEYRGTVIFVSHRAERITQADEIWHLAGGVIAEMGPPARVLSRDGATRRLLRPAPVHAA
ncbi:MAG: ABC transporter ATP-binding protein [Alphaproteobacteria bacterium]|nr:MAG: ABC transporter ATP-binding protein [Alphaproteobacteria bacterium]